MAKNEKKISISVIDRVMKENFRDESVLEWYGVEVRIKRTISISEMLAFVNDVVTGCFQEGLGFMPELSEFLIGCNILTRYANFNLPSDLEHRYRIVSGSDAVEFVTPCIDKRQMEEIRCSIYKKLDSLCETRAFDLEQKFRAVMEQMEQITDKTKSMFDGVAPGAMRALVETLATGKVDEEKLVEAYQKHMPRAEETGAEGE